MSYRLDTKHQGIIIYNLSQNLTKAEVTSLAKDVEKILQEGKSKIILTFTKEAATGPVGYGHVQNAFVKLRILAQKMKGDILYVLPQHISSRIEGTYPDVALALQVVSVGTTAEVDAKVLRDLTQQVVEATAKVEKLQKEVDILRKKNQELADMVGKPSTSAEMKEAIDHYRNLASELQSVAPIVRSKPTS